jgi:hypothetical protein
MKHKINIFIIVLIVPMLIGNITNFGYISGYVRDVISPVTFKAQYDFEIYRYRILSKYLLLETDKILSKTPLNDMDNMFTRITKFIDNSGTVSFYFSYFAVNTFFAILSSILFYFLCRDFLFNSNKKNILLAVLIYNTIIPLFQYVLVPYDYSSFFFNNLIIYIFLSNLKNNSFIKTILLLISIILGTLNRETAALAIAFMMVIVYQEKKSIIESLKILIIPIIIFILTYFGLRLFYGFDSGLINKLNLIINLIAPLNLFGIFTGIISVYIIYFFADNKEIIKSLNLFLIFSFPYIAVTLLGGVAYEIRLWTPLLINLVILLLYYKRRILNANI